MGNINSEIESIIYELLLHPYSAAEYVNPIILVVSSLGLILFAAVVIGIPIALIIACVCNTRYARKFGFPTCSWMNPTTKIRCICCPSCYCVGVHANPDRSGSLITLPCEECCYTILHCPRPCTSWTDQNCWVAWKCCSCQSTLASGLSTSNSLSYCDDSQRRTSVNSSPSIAG